MGDQAFPAIGWAVVRRDELLMMIRGRRAEGKAAVTRPSCAAQNYSLLPARPQWANIRWLNKESPLFVK